MSRFGIQQIKLNGTLYPGVKGYLLTRNLTVASEGSDGTVNETAHHVIRRAPSADLTTLSLKTVIAALADGTDFPVLALNGTTGLIMYGAKQESNAVGFLAGSTHISRTGLNGLVYMSGIRWAPGQKAEMALRAMFTSTDGTTDPISDDTSVALPTQPVPDFGFALSACTVNGSTINAIDSLDIGIDPKFDYDYSAGLPCPVSIQGAGVNGKLAITARASIGDCDLGAGTGAVSFVFKRFASGGGFGSDTVTLTLNGNWTTEESIGGENGRDMGRGLLVRTVLAGSTKPLTWTTA